MIAQAEQIDTLENIAERIECLWATLSVDSDCYIESVFQIGKLLHHANKQFARKGNGSFCKWIKQSLSVSRKAANNYMQAYRRFGVDEYRNLVRNANLDAIYALYRQPETVVEQAAQLAESGEHITLASLNDIEGYQPASWLSAKSELETWARRHEATSPELVAEVRKSVAKFR